MLDVIADTLYFSLKTRQTLIGFLGIEFEYASHLYLPQAHDIFPGKRAPERRFPWLHELIDPFDSLVHVGSLLKLRILIHPLLYEYLLEGCE